MALVMSGPCGGMGGHAFSSPMDPNTNLLVVRVWVQQDDCIAGMQISYELDGTVYWSDVWGHTEGEAIDVNLQDGEFMGSINGTVGKVNDCIVVVRSIAFTTNFATYAFGPSDEADHPFNLSAGNDGKIAGFFGYSGRLVDAIGVLVKPNTVPVKEGPCGGAGGGEFSMDMNADTTLLGANIWARDDDCIAGIQVHYQITGQEDTWSRVWGSEDGTLYKNSFGDRSLKSIRGYMGFGNWGIFVVTALSFVTDDGTTFGPYGNETGAPFTFEAGNVGKIVGIHGRCGALIDAIGVIMLN